MQRQDFHFLKDHIYLDSAAAMLKPQQVIKAITNFYLNYPINPHSPDSSAGVFVLQTIAQTRALTAKLIKAKSEEIIFTSGTTDSLNKIAQMLWPILDHHQEIVIAPTNHASAVVPFIELAKKIKAKIIVSENIVEAVNENTCLVIIAQHDNVVNTPIDLAKLYAKAQKAKALVINDAAQAIAHEPVSLKEADIISFSVNKLYGPTGLGVLAIKKDLLAKLKPATFGGGATAKIEKQLAYQTKSSIEAFEPGSPNTAGIFGFKAALEYFQNIDLQLLMAKEKKLALYAYQKLQTIKDIEIYSAKGDVNILFNVANFNAQDIVSYLGHKNVILRAGGHCAHLFSQTLVQKSSIRLSLAFYNETADIDQVVKLIKEGGDFLDFI